MTEKCSSAQKVRKISSILLFFRNCSRIFIKIGRFPLRRRNFDVFKNRKHLDLKEATAPIAYTNEEIERLHFPFKILKSFE